MGVSLREKLALLEHKQWVSWSRALADELATIKVAIKHGDLTGAMKLIDRRLNRWTDYWIPYDALPASVQDKDRVWADKVLQIINQGDEPKCQETK